MRTSDLITANLSLSSQRKALGGLVGCARGMAVAAAAEYR